MARRCSQCNGSGHDIRNCIMRLRAPAVINEQNPENGGRRGGASGPGGGPSRRCCQGQDVRLFGVKLTDGPFIGKSTSLGNIRRYNFGAALNREDPAHLPDGYLSEGAAHGPPENRRRIVRKKGTPWTKEEHHQFLAGLRSLGRGNWRGISRKFIPSRTGAQVASHAQKYFLRLKTNLPGMKRRHSLFDIAIDMDKSSSSKPNEVPMAPQRKETDDAQPLPVRSQVAAAVDDAQILPIESQVAEAVKDALALAIQSQVAEAIDDEQPVPVQSQEAATVEPNSLPPVELSLKIGGEYVEATSFSPIRESKDIIPVPRYSMQEIQSLFPAFAPHSLCVWASDETPPNEDRFPVPAEPVNLGHLAGVWNPTSGQTSADAGPIELSLLSLKLPGEL